MEQNADTGAQMTPVIDNKQKSGNGLKIATAIACVVAVCGIGFGVYGMMQSSQKDSQISDLKVQIKENDGTITTIETPEIETTTDNGTTITIVDSPVKNENPEDYIYVGEWGIKIKIPEELKMASYAFQHYKYAGQEDRMSLAVTGTTTDVNVLPDFGNIEECGGLGTVGRLKKGTETLDGGLIFSDDSYDYYYSSPQAACSASGSEQELEIAALNLIKQMLTNPNNYSKI